MPVPGLTPELPLKAKVRVGQRQEIKGKMLPVSTDHFVCEDETFHALAGDQPKSLRVHFPYAQWTEVFPSGLERWVKGQKSQILTCYTKGDGTAHRLTKGLKNPDGTWKMDPTVLADRAIKDKRRDMPCAAQKCAYFGKERTQGCRPQARLNFQLVDGPRDSVYKFETKGLNSIESIQGVLEQYQDLRGIEFEMTVEMVKRGAHEFPIVHLAEVRDPLVPPPAAEPHETDAVRRDLVAYLEETDRHPPTSAQVDWIVKVGPTEALRVLKERDASA